MIYLHHLSYLYNVSSTSTPKRKGQRIKPSGISPFRTQKEEKETTGNRKKERKWEQESFVPQK